MRTIKRIACILLLVVFAFSTYAFAAPATSLSEDSVTISMVDDVTMRITVKGIANKPNAQVFARILYPGQTLTEDTTDLYNVVAFQQQKKADEDGNYIFDVKLKEVGDNIYNVKLGVIGEDADYEDDITYYGATYRNEALEKFNEAIKDKSTDKFYTAMDTYYANLYLTTSLYNGDPTSVAEQFVNGDKIAKVSDIAVNLDIAALFVSFKNASSGAEVQSLIENNTNHVKITDSTAYATMKAMDDKIKNNTLMAFAANPGYTSTEAVDNFNLIVIKAALNNAIGADAVKGVLKPNQEIIGIDLSTMGLVDDDYTALIDNLGSVKKLSDIKTVLKKIKADRIEEENKNNNNNNNHYGGGGGGGAGVPVIVAPQPEVKVELPFKDMEEHIWAKEAVLDLYSKGVVSGASDTSFEPERNVNREEFIKLLVIAFGKEDAKNGADVNFIDVDSSMWYYDYIKAAVNCGIVKGRDDNTFGIGEPITRQDMVVMIHRVFEGVYGNKVLSGTTNNFVDTDMISSYAVDSINFAVNNGIVNGVGNSQFAPLDNSTRAEAAVTIYRAMNAFEKLQ